ncbi:hypothetical protein GQ607_011110 [Colletotrichum asianum]|uniref:Uncharacterized protein n=1 Tax=Colletotrichum asianum TaxID=702518 RepID=A0A8H3W989_9PEZI|nr:hypothetical protein GQ607_011110 [Colletotrichum asianum]
MVVILHAAKNEVWNIKYVERTYLLLGTNAYNTVLTSRVEAVLCSTNPPSTFDKMELTCGGNCTKGVDDPTDADMVGFGVLAAFIFPVIASHFFVMLSYITSNPNPDGDAPAECGIHPDQHSQLDKTILRRIRPSPSRYRLLYKLQYQQIILPLSDQLLITTLGLMIALYSQICTMSVFTFDVGLNLAWVSAGVHMDCLVALSKYFHEHKTQANFRTFSMVLLLVFLLVTELCSYIMWENGWFQVASCALHFPLPTNTALNRAAWLAMCYWVSGGYYDSIVQLRNATEVFTPAYTTVIRLTRLFCRSPERRKAFEALERKERARVRYEYDRSRGKLKEAHLLWWEKWWIALPVLLDDVSESVCWAIYTNVSFTVYNMFNLIRVLKADEVDASPLKEPKFGQIMPLIMPLIIVLGVFEASSNKNEKNQLQSNDDGQNLLQASTHDSVSDHQLHNTAFGMPTRARTTGAEGPWSRNRTDVSFGSTAAAASHGIHQPRVRRIDYGDEDGIPLIAHTPATTADDQLGIFRANILFLGSLNAEFSCC